MDRNVKLQKSRQDARRASERYLKKYLNWTIFQNRFSIVANKMGIYRHSVGVRPWKMTSRYDRVAFQVTAPCERLGSELENQVLAKRASCNCGKGDWCLKANKARVRTAADNACKQNNAHVMVSFAIVHVTVSFARRPAYHRDSQCNDLSQNPDFAWGKGATRKPTCSDNTSTLIVKRKHA